MYISYLTSHLGILSLSSLFPCLEDCERAHWSSANASTSASKWASVGFAHLSGFIFVLSFWPLCRSFFPGQWYIYKYMFLCLIQCKSFSAGALIRKWKGALHFSVWGNSWWRKHNENRSWINNSIINITPLWPYLLLST